MTGYNYSSDPRNPVNTDRRRAQQQKDFEKRVALARLLLPIEDRIAVINKELVQLRLNLFTNRKLLFSAPQLTVMRRQKKKLSAEKKELIIKRDQIKE